MCAGINTAHEKKKDLPGAKKPLVLEISADSAGEFPHVHYLFLSIRGWIPTLDVHLQSLYRVTELGVTLLLNESH